MQELEQDTRTLCFYLMFVCIGSLIYWFFNMFLAFEGSFTDMDHVPEFNYY